MHILFVFSFPSPVWLSFPDVHHPDAVELPGSCSRCNGAGALQSRSLTLLYVTFLWGCQETAPKAFVPLLIFFAVLNLASCVYLRRYFADYSYTRVLFFVDWWDLSPDMFDTARSQTKPCTNQHGNPHRLSLLGTSAHDQCFPMAPVMLPLFPFAAAFVWSASETVPEPNVSFWLDLSDLGMCGLCCLCGLRGW